VAAFRLESLSDELDIVQPARDYIRGDLYAAVKYPSFVFYFYGFFFRLFGTTNNAVACLHVARIVNYFLFAANLILLHIFLRKYFSKLWALVGSILFTTLPPIAFSAAYVKTEGLLLCQLLCVLLVLGRISASPKELRWHSLAALGAGLSFSTKLSPLPLLLYVANAIYLRFHGSRIAPRAWLLFCGTLFVVILASWTNLWIFDKVIESWRSDIYFLPGAGPFNAVDEGILSGFPYGRFSSFVTVSMPIALGLVGLFFVASIVVGSIPRWIFWVFGGGNLASLAIALGATRLRLPHGFTHTWCSLWLAASHFSPGSDLANPAVARFSILGWHDFSRRVPIADSLAGVRASGHHLRAVTRRVHLTRPTLAGFFRAHVLQ